MVSGWTSTLTCSNIAAPVEKPAGPVSRSGCLFLPSHPDRPVVRHDTDELLGGNGLWLVNQVCDLVQARTGQAGTTTRLHMRLHRP